MAQTYSSVDEFVHETFTDGDYLELLLREGDKSIYALDSLYILSRVYNTLDQLDEFERLNDKSNMTEKEFHSIYINDDETLAVELIGDLVEDDYVMVVKEKLSSQI